MKITPFLIFLSTFLTLSGLCQTEKIDSLERAISQEKNKLKHVNLLHAYVWELAYYNPEESIEPAKEALKLSEELSDSSLIAKSYNRIGLVFDYAGNFDLAEKNYKRAYQIKLKADGESETDGLLNNLGSVYYYLGRYQESMDYYLKSLKIREAKVVKADKSTLKPVAQSYNNIALLLKRQKNFSGAIDYYRKALSIKNDLKDFDGIITTRSNLGVLYMEQDSLQLAKNEFLQSLELAGSINDFVSKAMILNNLGLLNVRMNDRAKAESYYRQSAEIYDQVNDEFGKSAVLVNLASLFYDNNQIEKALESAEEVLKIGEANGAADVKLSGLKLLSKIQSKRNPALSLVYLNEYIELKDSIDNLEVNRQISQQAIIYETEKKEIEIDLLKKDQAIDQAEIEQQEIIIARNRNYVIFLVVGSILVLVLASALVLYFRSRKEAAEQRASKLRIEHQREIDNIRKSLAKELEVEDDRNTHPMGIGFGISQEELNQYLLNPLSDREIEVLYKIAKGKMNKEIAEELFISVNTVKTHILHIYEKLDVQNRTEAAVKASGMKILK